MKSVFKVVKVRNDFAKFKNVAIQDVADSLYVEAEGIMTASKTLYVPVVTGNLKNSGTVLKPTMTDGKVEVVLGYGMGTSVGGDVTYAALVHEYPKSYGQGRNKYLSIPANIAIKNMASRIAKAVERSAKARRNP